MTVPLILLAIPSIFLGMVLGLPLGDGPDRQWLEPVFEQAQENLGMPPPRPFQFLGIDGVLIIGQRGRWRRSASRVGIWLFGFYWPLRGTDTRRSRSGSQRSRSALRPLYRASFNKWWFDDLNDLIFVRFGGARRPALWWFDVRVIDGTVNGVGDV